MTFGSQKSAKFSWFCLLKVQTGVQTRVTRIQDQVVLKRFPACWELISRKNLI